ncbi:hypothetical protein Hypma_010853 [Hypsizygus marmoreus]|uniref:Cytochrome P450 n=1 Tax=Hypsizygus marmoreus TaxID=39966 RepID=A0A369JMK6_HYPMA|nr:hypothetical protein Hypma_010853 [Hypsizygus marmoreus]
MDYTRHPARLAQGFDISSGVKLSLLVILAFVVLVRSRNKVRHPPGPSGLPIVGNALQIPKDKQWLVWDQWKRLYGDVIYIRIFGSPTIIVSSHKAATELLDGRGLLYSGRPRAMMAGELVGWNKGLGYNPGPPDPRFKEFRSLFNSFIGPRACAENREEGSLRKTQEKENLRFLEKLLNEPERFFEHARESTSSLILLLSYGYHTQAGDPLDLVKIVEDAMAGFSRASDPGWWVDSIPFLRHIPWLPFQQAARGMRADLVRLYDVPFGFVKEEMERGTAKPSFTSDFLEDKKGAATPEDEELIQAAAASLYSGGADTTPSSLTSFILAMTLNPVVQTRAQNDIDALMKASSAAPRLPTIADKERLPYVSALVKEVWRWNPVVPLGLPHLVTEDDEYRGYTIEKGTVVWANIWSILHDEEIFPDSFTFKPERFLDSEGISETGGAAEAVMSAFGFGRRVCPGLHLAENTVFIAVVTMLYFFNITKAIDETTGKEIAPEEDFSGFIWRIGRAMTVYTYLDDVIIASYLSTTTIDTLLSVPCFRNWNMPNSLVIGASRGLGLEIAKALHADGHKVFATVRSSGSKSLPIDVIVISNIDIAQEDAGSKIVEGLKGAKLDLVVVNAGVFKKETLETPNFADEIDMYKVVAIAPVFLAHHLWKANALSSPSKFILITTEGGSISLRTKEEGGGNYGHHGSKAAANMVGKLLSNDFYDKGITVAMIHPGFMKTDMTKGVGFDQFYESGGGE